MKPGRKSRRLGKFLSAAAGMGIFVSSASPMEAAKDMKYNDIDIDIAQENLEMEPPLVILPRPITGYWHLRLEEGETPMDVVVGINNYKGRFGPRFTDMEVYEALKAYNHDRGIDMENMGAVDAIRIPCWEQLQDNMIKILNRKLIDTEARIETMPSTGQYADREEIRKKLAEYSGLMLRIGNDISARIGKNDIKYRVEIDSLRERISSLERLVAEQSQPQLREMQDLQEPLEKDKDIEPQKTVTIEYPPIRGPGANHGVSLDSWSPDTATTEKPQKPVKQQEDETIEEVQPVAHGEGEDYIPVIVKTQSPGFEVAGKKTLRRARFVFGAGRDTKDLGNGSRAEADLFSIYMEAVAGITERIVLDMEGGAVYAHSGSLDDFETKYGDAELKALIGTGRFGGLVLRGGAGYSGYRVTLKGIGKTGDIKDSESRVTGIGEIGYMFNLEGAGESKAGAVLRAYTGSDMEGIDFEIPVLIRRIGGGNNYALEITPIYGDRSTEGPAGRLDSREAGIEISIALGSNRHFVIRGSYSDFRDRLGETESRGKRALAGIGFGW